MLNRHILQEEARTGMIEDVAREDPLHTRPQMIRTMDEEFEEAALEQQQPGQQQPTPPTGQTQPRPQQQPQPQQRQQQQQPSTFEGYGLFGYDHDTRQFTHVWADNKNTRLAFSAGEYDESTRTFTFYTIEPEPSSMQTPARPGMNQQQQPQQQANQQEDRARVVVRIISDDQHMVEYFHTTPDGRVSRTMEIQYTRQGAAR